METSESAIFFFIGTEAELIKIFPVITALKDKNIPIYILSSGQNDISRSRITLEVIQHQPDLILSDESLIKKSALGLFLWFWKTYRGAQKRIRARFQNVSFKHSLMVVHGDTVSTLMGTWIAQKLNMRVAHIEAGLRSHHLFNPFPEEIDRILTSKKADYHLAPGELACANLKKKKNVINTQLNTIYDSLQISLTIPAVNPLAKKIPEFPFFVLVLHRQENLMNKKFVEQVLRNIADNAKTMHCIFILHKPTERALADMGFLPALEKNDSFILTERMDYFDFMQLLKNAQFVITDGGSNQEELYYMGKPCLILRTSTERPDGLGKNALLYNGDLSTIHSFLHKYKQYERPLIQAEISPSHIIANCLVDAIKAP